MRLSNYLDPDKQPITRFIYVALAIGAPILIKPYVDSRYLSIVVLVFLCAGYYRNDYQDWKTRIYKLAGETGLRQKGDFFPTPAFWFFSFLSIVTAFVTKLWFVALPFVIFVGFIEWDRVKLVKKVRPVVFTLEGSILRMNKEYKTETRNLSGLTSISHSRLIFSGAAPLKFDHNDFDLPEFRSFFLKIVELHPDIEISEHMQILLGEHPDFPIRQTSRQPG
jgi:hypothetical protein